MGVDPLAQGMAGAALAAQAPDILAASKVIRSYRRGLSPIAGVIGVAPTFSQAATNAASTINASNAVASTTTNVATGRYSPADTNYVEQIGGPLLYNGTSGYLGNAVINVLATPTRQGGHGMGIRFATRAAAVELGMQNSGSDIIVYVTDPATRVRARVQTLDQTTTTGLSYVKWTFASAALRIWEIYPVSFTRLTNIVVATSDSIWPSPSPDEPRVGVLWDSWSTGTSSGLTAHTALRLTLTDYMGERLGVANPISFGVASTGLLNGSNVATSGTFRQRIAAGDIDASRIGNLDLLLLPCSLNDAPSTDGQVQAEYTLTITQAMTAQPNAVIVGAGPQYTPNAAAAQSRFDACRAGFLAAAGTARRAIYLDNSATGENWLFSGINSTVIGADGFHPNDAGMPYAGYRIGDSIIAAVRARYGALVP